MITDRSAHSLRPSTPIPPQQPHDLPLRARILSGNLHRRPTLHKIQHHAMRQLLPVQVRSIRRSEVGERELLRRGALVLHCLGNGKAEVACGVDGEDATFPELKVNSIVSQRRSCRRLSKRYRRTYQRVRKLHIQTPHHHRRRHVRAPFLLPSLLPSNTSDIAH